MAYGDKRDFPKIETWTKLKLPEDAGRQLVTTWSATVFEARQRRAEALGLSVVEVMGRRVK